MYKRIVMGFAYKSVALIDAPIVPKNTQDTQYAMYRLFVLCTWKVCASY
jgi:hypothetical protein